MTSDFAVSHAAYRAWFTTKFACNLVNERRRYAENASWRWEQLSRPGRVWPKLCTELQLVHDRHGTSSRFRLLTNRNTEHLKLDPKDFDELVDKTWRKNIVANAGAAKGQAPEGGWITHENWDERILDILRTTVTVRFLDGVKEVVDSITEFAIREGVEFEPPDWQSKVGHCAVHVVLRPEVEYRSAAGPDVVAALPIEIQVSTQLQDVACELTHPIYERRRLTNPDEWELEWSEDPHFVANHVPFGLHLVDGVILAERRKLGP
jgi:ppGpp synthetase/RelA/SpoT-type nucleotidyltranferase